MATVKELLRAENDGTLSFGDYTLASKTATPTGIQDKEGRI